MKRKASDQESAASYKRHFSDSDWAPSASEDAEADTASVFSAASTLQPTPGQTLAGTSITASSPSSRTGRKFPSDLKTIKCTFVGCPKTFNRPARLAAHLRSHANDRPFRCPYEACGKNYIEEKHLSQHVKGSHTHERRYACQEPDCTKSFVTATRLRRHAAVHEGAERFRCRGYDGCSQSFRKHQTLQRHIRTAHLDQSAYTCGNDGCDVGFDTASALRRHIEREHGELKFWCDECTGNGGDGDGEDDDDYDDTPKERRRIGFTTLLLLQAHMRREHINCMFCDAKCGSQGDLERHIDKYHSGTTVEERKTVACTWEGCDKRFTRVSNLNTHVKTAHEGLRFVCGQVDTFGASDIADWNWMEEGCGADFVSRLKLEEHVRFIHLGRRRPPKLYTMSSSTNLSPVVTDELTGVATARNIPCTVAGCPAKFIRYRDIDRHIQKDHQSSDTNIVANGYGDQDHVIDPRLTLPLQPGESCMFAAGAADSPMQGNFDAEWTEMRQLIDIDALVDGKK
ncbi:hypothetical protein B0T26DRAFT_720483 [Lasiosphaeria miniovina]|uniref:C2H2-type domain-containing protein n=1 Tax=Lasiosphaeria miniovina TaxID=1954250 RepID=A0AA40A4F9_9PEZI|nr:uncharacterized protein B0T26DRAFT_720483 [Lasiosphaeria miniovina]KAK0709121.1 hypothetical protein B0T26DRAFT_720483 [Lasiosphaeria miniovina]